MTLILEKISTATSSFPEEPPFTKVSQIDLRRKSMQCAHNQTWSRSLPQLTDITPSGLVAPLFAHSPLSKLNGSPRMSTRRAVSKLYTENASEKEQDMSKEAGVQMLESEVDL